MVNISLDRQIHIYSVDTGAFYTNNENRLHWKIQKLKQEKKQLKKKLYDLSKISDKTDEDLHKIDNIGTYLKIKNKLINSTKTRLLTKLSRYVDRNNNSESKQLRSLSQNSIVDKNVISVFESSLTRMLDLKTDELSNDIVIVKVYYYDILKDLVCNGFTFNGEKYVYFTSSAGQIRTKKAVFLKESQWIKHEKTLMCGLTKDIINEKGGINVNKFLAYLALSNSATDLLTDIYPDFNINKCIVVDDFETMVNGLVDYIDMNNYTIKRKIMDIPINHTDGCGLILSGVTKNNYNFMVRLPWVKGLLSTFPIYDFIRKADKEHPDRNHAIVKDIYGTEHNIIAEGITIIFTKSQFKMYKYYSSWDEYKNNFIKYKCEAGYCNLEDNYISDATINYQMIQTLCNMTKEELIKISEKSRTKLSNLTSSVTSMLEAFGVTKFNNNKNCFQQALEIYPELLTDIYSKESLNEIKKSMIKQYKSAKLNISAKYSFIVPDLYAFCEFLFLGNKNPDGLLKNGEVSCSLYNNKELACLRSPHLYREWAVRNNVFSDNIKKWFTTRALYASCHDLISKILQYDCDGDKSLIVSEPLLIDIAKRHMTDIVPLYYEMKKAEPTQLNGINIYSGLEAAFTGGNIGVISNDISKIWNSENINNKTLECIKYLCAENNFVIDYAKTLYKPTRPKSINQLIRSYTKLKVPYFFKYAKDKTDDQVEKKNKSVVNLLDTIIKNSRLKYPLKEFGRFDYKLLMSNSDIDINDNLIKEYIKLNNQYHYKVNMEDKDKSNICWIAKVIKSKLSESKLSDSDITDMLVKYLYHIKNSKCKSALWFCYGDIILHNLKTNIGNRIYICEKCGKRYCKTGNNQKYCDECKGYQKVNSKTLICIDCGNEFVVDARNTTKTRCNKCQDIKNKQLRILRNKRYYNKIKSI